MRTPIITILILSVLTFSSAVASDVKPNIVIQQITDTYKFVPSKDGSSIDKVEHSSEIVFRANRVAGDAIAVAPYDDFIKINKVSGEEKAYGSYFSDDVFFSDSKACMIKTSIKKAGGTAKASYRRTYTKPEFFCRVILPDIYDVENATVIFEIPSSLESRFSIDEKNIPEGMMEKNSGHKGNNLILTYNFKDIPTPTVGYADAPSINITSPQLLIKGHFADVNELYRYLHSYIDPNDPDGGAVETKAREITADCKDDAERIGAITDFVHNSIRYVAVEHGEFGQKPDFPSAVLSKAYGDCKGSAALLTAMLKAVGIDARLAWVGTDAIGQTWTESPNVSSGNHMIAAAMTGDSILFIDGTSKFSKAGDLSLSIQGRQALIEDGPEKCIVATIPVAATNTEKSDITLSMRPDGIMDIKGTITRKGSFFRSLLAKIDDTTPAKRPQLFGKLFAAEIPGSTSSEATYREEGRTSVISGTASVSGIIKNVGNDIYVDINPAPWINNMKFDLEDRKVGGKINGPCRYESTLSLKLSEGLEAGDLPKSVSVKSDWYTGSIDTKLSDDGRTVIRHFIYSIEKRDVDFKDLEEFNKGIVTLNRSASAKIVLKNK